MLQLQQLRQVYYTFATQLTSSFIDCSHTQPNTDKQIIQSGFQNAMETKLNGRRFIYLCYKCFYIEILLYYYSCWDLHSLVAGAKSLTLICDPWLWDGLFGLFFVLLFLYAFLSSWILTIYELNFFLLRFFL